MGDMCSMLSACICGLGYYTTLWGQLKEGETKKDIKGNVSASDEKVPLLQDQKQEGDSQLRIYLSLVESLLWSMFLLSKEIAIEKYFKPEVIA
ncbi:hypothetical protein RND71_010485 [Anisodus tanguticus]|uniref:Uncharacterized protein n=1 Tax=Anisodus tanguticus TaxID=243964 RepID=A0AAE1SJA7_9SOLA|nr:hypothetical protein RND71_010485 [Anisodus tanguticus]